MPCMSPDLSLSFLDEEIRDERCKGAYLKVRTEATLSYEVAQWSPRSPPL